MDVRRLLEEADAVTVAKFIQMEIENHKYHYIRCPGHESRLGKPDRNIGNAYLKRNGYICYACGVFVPTHDMVVEFLNCSKEEAYKIMADAMAEALDGTSGEQRYCLSQKVSNQKPQIRLTQNEAKVIGLYEKFTVIVTQKTVKGNSIPICEGLSLLYQDNPFRYYQMIVSKAQSMKQKYEDCLLQYARADAEKAYILFEMLQNDFDNSIYMQLERELRSRIDTCQKIINIFLKAIEKTHTH